MGGLLEGSHADPVRFADHWYTQGSMIGCAKASGTNCGPDAPCCEKPMEPTLKASDHLTYRILKDASYQRNLNASSKIFTRLAAMKSLKALSGNEDPPTRKLRGLATKGLASTSDTYFRMNPWLAPGHAPVANVCGTLGAGDSTMPVAISLVLVGATASL